MIWKRDPCHLDYLRELARPLHGWLGEVEAAIDALEREQRQQGRT